MWLKINDVYECCIDGRVRNNKTGRELKQWFAGAGYKYTRIGGAGSRKCGVHRIVGELFLPAPTEEGLEIDHIDRNKENNHASNLRWVSPKENSLNKDLEKNSRKHNKLNELFISKVISLRQKTPTYKVRINNKYMDIYKTFKTLEEAKNFRDSIINV